MRVDPTLPPNAFTSPGQAILIVDDEPEIRATLAATFRRALPGVEVTTAENGLAGLEALRSRAFDLVLSDHQMPGMGGLDLLAHARDLQPESVRVLMTGYPELDLAMRGLNEKILERFLTKPFRAMDVAALATSLLEERRARRMQGEAFRRSMELLRRRVGEPADPASGPRA